MDNFSVLDAWNTLDTWRSECLEFEMVLILHAVYFRLHSYFSSLLIAIKLTSKRNLPLNHVNVATETA